MNKLLLFSLLIGLGLSSCLNSNDDVFNPQEQFEKEQAAIDAYIAENGLTVQKDSTLDLRYSIERQGTGDFPKDSDLITVNYTGKFLDNGNTFDEADSVTFTLSNLIPGWRILLPYLREGGKMTMYIPSYYGYGNADQGKIPANSTLIFEVELHFAETQFEFEQRKIDEYLEKEELTAEIDSAQSLRFIITEEGTGENPKATDKINVNYTGKFLADGKVFESRNDITLSLNTLIPGWKVLIPYIKEGGSITMFLPSKFAYGSSGTSTIPPNTPLIFEVKLNEILVD